MKRVQFYYRGYTCTMRPTTKNHVSLGIFGPPNPHGPALGEDGEEALGRELDSRIIRCWLGPKITVALAKRRAKAYIDARQACWVAIESTDRCW